MVVIVFISYGIFSQKIINLNLHVCFSKTKTSRISVDSSFSLSVYFCFPKLNERKYLKVLEKSFSSSIKFLQKFFAEFDERGTFDIKHNGVWRKFLYTGDKEILYRIALAIRIFQVSRYHVYFNN